MMFDADYTPPQMMSETLIVDMTTAPINYCNDCGSLVASSMWYTHVEFHDALHEALNRPEPEPEVVTVDKLLHDAHGRATAADERRKAEES